VHFNVESGEQSTPIESVHVSGDYFATLAAPALFGRTLTNADDRESGGADGPVA
jgi:hypothetical protein